MQGNLNYYEILEIAPDAGSRDIKKAYFSQVRKFPPERFPEEFKKIREAYDFLSDEESREEYNLVLDSKQKEDGFSQYFQQGKDAYREERYDEAQKLFRQALEIRPEEKMVWNFIGLCLLDKEEYDQAVSIYKKLAAEFPESKFVHFNLGIALFEKNAYKQALSAFENALKLDPENVNTWVEISSCYRAGKDYEKAREVLEEGLKVCGENISIYYKLIDIDAIQNDMERLSFDIKRLVKLAKKDPAMKENVAWYLADIAAHVLIDMPDFSAKLLETAKKLNPDQKEIKKLYKEASKKRKLQEPWERLQKDPQVHPWIKDILEGHLEEMFDFFGDLDLSVRERLILRNPTNVLSSVEHIKNQYPEIFKEHKKFLRKILDHPTGAKVDEEKLLEDLNHINGMIDEGYEDDEFTLDDIYIPPMQRINPEKIGRNDPCPCGSGKKYKKCCGA